MLINLTDCFKVHGKTEKYDVDYDEKFFEYFGEKYPVVKYDKAHLVFTNVGDGNINVTGNFNVVLKMNCSRCLKDVESTVEVEFDSVLTEPDGFHEIDEEQLLFMEMYELDTTKLINNELIMSLPMKILCKEDCKGLCLKCGKNLNDGDCGCDRFVPDPRMAAIQDIFNAYNKEV